MRLQDIRTVIATWIKSCQIPYVTVIVEKTAKQRPQKPYVVISLLNAAEKLGAVDESKTVNGVTSVVGYRQSTFTIKFIGRRASEELTLMRDTLDLPETQNLFRAGGLAVMAADMVRDVSIALDAEYEEQAVFDLVLGYSASTQSKAGFFESATITGAVEGSHSTITVLKTVVKN